MHVVLITGCSSGLGRALAYTLFTTKNDETGTQDAILHTLVPLIYNMYSLPPLANRAVSLPLLYVHMHPYSTCAL